MQWKKWLGVWLIGLCLSLNALDLYVAPAARGTGSGTTAENAALWTDKNFWRYTQQKITGADVTVHFDAGTYLASRVDGVEDYLVLSSKGSADHTLTLLGAPDQGTVLMRDPAESAEQTDDNRLTQIIMMNRCTNVTVDNLHFTGKAAVGKGITIQTPDQVVIRNCSWTDMRGAYYGAVSISSKGSGVIIENCLFDYVGYSNYAHCLYNLYHTSDILIRNCIFRDCSGEYVRFRHGNNRCTVENCLFENTGKFANRPFIVCPVFNDEDPAVKTDPADHEYFAQNLTIRNNTFIGIHTESEPGPYMLDFWQDGYNPIGKQYLVSRSEAAALAAMPVEEARAWTKERLDIDFDTLQWVNNTGHGVAGAFRYRSLPNFGAEEEFPRSEYENNLDLSRLLRDQQNRSAQLPEEMRAVWLWGDTLADDDGRAAAAKLKTAGVNTVFLMAKNAYGETPWNSEISLQPDAGDTLVKCISTFRDYGMEVHLWFICHSDRAWIKAHPEDRVWHYGQGGDPAQPASGDGICPLSGCRDYQLSLIREIVSQPTRFPIAGIHLVPRYTHSMYCFCPAHLQKAADLGIDTDAVRAALLAGFGTDGKGDGKAYYARLRAGDPAVKKWVAMREAEMREFGEAAAALLAQYQPSLILSLSAAEASAKSDITVGRCQYALHLESQGPNYDLVCTLGDHTAAGQTAAWCSDLAVRATLRSGVPALTGMGSGDDAAAVIADSRTRGGSAGFGVFRYETMPGAMFTALGAAATHGYAGDLDNNGRSDILLVDSAGNTGAWLTFADDTLAWRPLSAMGDGFAVLDYGYAAGGKNTPDIYLYNAVSGVVGLWQTDVLGVTNWQTVGTFDPDSSVIGLGDFNGDGISDLLLCSRSGDVGCFLGGSDAIAGWHYFQSIGPDWTIPAIGDLDGDGIDDIVLRHSTGSTGVWLIRRLTPVWRDLGVLNRASQIAGCGDFDGDGIDDVLIRIGAACGAWMIRDGAITAWRDLGVFEGAVEEITDWDNDGVSDLRIRTDAGDIGWLLVPQTAGEPLRWHYCGSLGDEWSTAILGR